MKSSAPILFIFFFLCFTVNAQTPSFRYAVIPEAPRPGEIVTVAIDGNTDAQKAVLIIDGKKTSGVNLYRAAAGSRGSFLTAVLAIPSTAKTGKAAIHIENSTGLMGEIELEIQERKFIFEDIHLDRQLTSIRTERDPVKDAEIRHLSQLLNSTGNEKHFFGKFIPPVSATRRTSHFGDRRRYLYSDGTSDTSIHSGIDYGVRTGTPVSACGPGRVVLARSRIITGNTVVIEHLPGIYSLYYHLNSIDVREGTLVAAGTLLGLSGNTGLSTAPHLHWELRVSGEAVDPDIFLSAPIIDKDAIISKIYE